MNKRKANDRVKQVKVASVVLTASCKSTALTRRLCLVWLLQSCAAPVFSTAAQRSVLRMRQKSLERLEYQGCLTRKISLLKTHSSSKRKGHTPQKLHMNTFRYISLQLELLKSPLCFVFLLMSVKHAKDCCETKVSPAIIEW